MTHPESASNPSGELPSPASSGKASLRRQVSPVPQYSLAEPALHLADSSTAQKDATILWMITCNRLIEDIHRRVANLRAGTVTPLDDVLDISKTTITDLMHVVKLPAMTDNPACPVLVKLALAQVAVLLEECVKATTQLWSKSPDLGIPTSERPDSLPELHLGSFCVEEGIDSKIRRLIVCREIERVVWAFGQISRSAKRQGQMSADASRTEDVVARLQTLSKSLNAQDEGNE